MASLNKVMLIGNLGKDPETRYTAAGDPVCNFSIATTEKWKDKSGDKQERTEWHRVTCWGRTAEIAGEYLRKGSSVYVEGSIRTSKYTDKDGVEKYSTDINCTQLTMLGDPRNSDGAAGNKNQSERRPAAQPKGGQSTDHNDFEDEIPF